MWNDVVLWNDIFVFVLVTLVTGLLPVLVVRKMGIFGNDRRKREIDRIALVVRRLNTREISRRNRKD